VSVILKRPWTKQPQVVVPPNFGNSLLSGAVELIHPVRGLGNLDAVSNAPWVNTGALLKASPSGMAVDTNGSTTYMKAVSTPLGAAILGADLWTIAAELIPRNASTDCVAFALASFSDSIPFITIRLNNTAAGQVALFMRDNAGNTNAIGVGSFTVGQVQRIVIANYSATSRKLFVNGVSVSGTATIGTTNVTQQSLGCLYRDTAAPALGLPFDGSVSQVFIAKGVAWTDSQAKAWIDNPNQLYAPLPRRIWAPAAGAPPPPSGFAGARVHRMPHIHLLRVSGQSSRYETLQERANTGSG
jgi:hypothetical protein